ncbi:MAG: 4Fe-4S dicluster domain-containing protein [Firmicutes bacterium]|nr:4Fe-4S dicluster domain-containing protein [Bacillota bacterium]
MQVITSKRPGGLDFSFAGELKERCRQPVELCYQCQKCTAGCPVGEFAEYRPNQIIRLVQFGLKEKIFSSNFLWLCTNCETCGARCPNGIKIAEVMDALREMAQERGFMPPKNPAFLFHTSFLASVKTFGRVHEASMLMVYKLKSRRIFEDLDTGIKYLLRRKFAIIPRRIKGRRQVRQIFASFRRR